MAIREIRTFEDEALRKRCRTVDVVDDRIRDILRDMVDTLRATPNAAGLAANQLGILRRLVVIETGETLLQLVNPELVTADGVQSVTEGCLSFPGLLAHIQRPAEVTVEALNEKGESIVVRGGGFMAKCLCHELDHLNGVVFLERADSIEDCAQESSEE